MNIGVLGTGSVGETIASALISKGHSVMMGSRSSTGEKAAKWVKGHKKGASQGSFNEAAAFGEIVFICLNGEFAISAIRTIDDGMVDRKIVVDVTNPLDFSSGMPPTILEGLGNSNSLGEEIQKELPHAFVVKALNTVNYKLMVDARKVNKGDHHLFLCGNDLQAKNQLKHFLVDQFHWKPDHLIDLGDITKSRAIEAILPFWVTVWQALGTPLFNFKIVQ
jgi:hypothetical protein